MRQKISQVGITQQNATCGVAGQIVSQENSDGGLDQLRMRGAECISEPAGHLKVHQPGQTFGFGCGSALAPGLRGIFAVPRCRVDQRECGSARCILSGKRLGHASTHRTSCDEHFLPPDAIEQLQKIARKQFRRERSGWPAGSAVSAAVVGKNFGATCECRNHTVPDAGVEC